MVTRERRVPARPSAPVAACELARVAAKRRGAHILHARREKFSAAGAVWPGLSRAPVSDNTVDERFGDDIAVRLARHRATSERGRLALGMPDVDRFTCTRENGLMIRTLTVSNASAARAGRDTLRAQASTIAVGKLPKLTTVLEDRADAARARANPKTPPFALTFRSASPSSVRVLGLALYPIGGSR